MLLKFQIFCQFSLLEKIPAFLVLFVSPLFHNSLYGNEFELCLCERNSCIFIALKGCVWKMCQNYGTYDHNTYFQNR